MDPCSPTASKSNLFLYLHSQNLNLSSNSFLLRLFMSWTSFLYSVAWYDLPLTNFWPKLSLNLLNKPKVNSVKKASYLQEFRDHFIQGVEIIERFWVSLHIFISEGFLFRLVPEFGESKDKEESLIFSVFFGVGVDSQGFLLFFVPIGWKALPKFLDFLLTTVLAPFKSYF